MSRLSSLRDPTRDELHSGPGRDSLPDDVRHAKREETVCKFCGVSYLVFSEIKDLEKRLIATEQELARFKANGELNRLREQVELLEARLTQHRAALRDAQVEIEAKAASSLAAVAEAERRGKERADHERLQSRIHLKALARHRRVVAAVRKDLQVQRCTVNELHSEAERMASDMSGLIESALSETRTMASRMRREAAATLEHAMATEHGLAVERERELRAELDAARVDLESERRERLREREDAASAHAASLAEEEARRENEVGAAETAAAELRAKLEHESSRLSALIASSQDSAAAASKSEHERKTLEDDLARAKRSAAMLSDDVQRAKSDAAKHRRRAEELEKGRALLLEERVELKTKIESLEHAGNTTAADVGRLHDEVVSLKDRIKVQASTASSSMEENRATLAATNVAHEAELEKLRADLMREVERERRERAATEERASASAAAAAQREAALRSAKDRSERKAAEAAELVVKTAEQAERAAGAATSAKESARIAESRLTAEAEARRAAVDTIAALRASEERLQRERSEAVRDAQAARAEANAARLEVSEANSAIPQGLEELECHLIKLSELVRTKDNRIKLLESTVHRECLERTKMMDELERLRQTVDS